MGTPFLPKGGTVYLPDTGRYLLWKTGAIIDSGIINIRDTGLTIIKYKEHEIQLFETGAIDASPIYVTCDVPINGYQEDHYPNGNLRIRGNFKNGHYLDSLVTFYPNGKTERRIHKVSNTVTREEYDDSGHIATLSHDEYKPRSDYWEYNETTFFPTGQIHLKNFFAKGLTTIQEFYPSGKLKLKQTKTKRTEYFENGSKRITYRWNDKRKWGGRNPNYDITVTKKSYDESGLVTRTTVYEDWGYSLTQPKFEISSSSWILSDTRYKEGIKVFSVDSMDTKDYLKKYPIDD